MNYTTSDYLEQLQQDKSDLVDNLTTKGIQGLTGDETFTELVPEVLNISGDTPTPEPPEKTVKFYDYDGTVVAEYTKEEFLALESLPANPTHTGLTAQGWNWSLSDAQNHVRNYDYLTIGQLYVTNDNKTRIYVTIDKFNQEFYTHFIVTRNYPVTVDFGDNTTETLTVPWSGSATQELTVRHKYSEIGDYVITISCSGTFGIGRNGTNSNVSTLLYATANTGTSMSGNPYSRNYLSAINKVELGDNVKLYTGAFYGCNNLESITIPNAITTAQTNYCKGLFTNCSNLKTITLPDIPLTTSENDFYGCNKIKAINLPKFVNNTLTLSSGFISECSSLEQITLTNVIGVHQNFLSVKLDKLKSIFCSGSTYSFNANCQSLTSLKQLIIIGNNNTTIPQNFLYNVKTIEKLQMDVSNVTTISSQAFSYSNYLIPIENFTSLIETQQQAFRGISNVPQNIVLPTSLTTIGTYFFANAEDLETVQMGNNVTSIGGYSFYACPKLKNVTLSNSLVSIGTSAFESTAIEEITLPDTLTTMETRVFQYAPITSLDLSNTALTTISLTNLNISTLSLPSTVTTFNISYCNNIKKVTLPEGVTSASLKNNNSLEEIIFPSTITSMPYNSCEQNPKLQKITMSASDVTYGSSIFYGCGAITEINFLEGVTNTGQSMFNSCYILKNVEMPSTLTTIASDLFGGGQDLETIDFSKHTVIPSMAGSLFPTQYNTKCKIIVPDNLYESWKVASVWSNYANYIISASDYEALQSA